MSTRQYVRMLLTLYVLEKEAGIDSGEYFSELLSAWYGLTIGDVYDWEMAMSNQEVYSTIK